MNKTRLMKLSVSMLTLIFFLNCGSTSATATKADMMSKDMVSYSKDIAPVFETKCAPCHFPPNGKKTHLNTLTSVKTNFDDIYRRVSLASDHKEFMPFKNKREPLTDSELKMLKDWADQDFGE